MRNILFTLLAVAAMAGSALSQESDEAVQRSIPTVTVASAVTTEMQARVPVSGTLVARQQVQVYPRVSGYEITEILAEAGDTVEKGQVLARLSTDTLSAQLAQAEAEYQRAEAGVSQARSNIDSAEASLTQARTSLERAQRLRQGGNASQAALDQAVAAEANARASAASAGDGLALAQAALAQADAARSIARLNLDRAEIAAPVAGLVVGRNAELGALSGGSAEPLFMMIANGSVEMEAEVIETALRSLSVGDPAEINVAGLGDIGGSVRLIPASVDPVTRLGLMRVSLEPHPGLRTGLFASGWIITARRDAVAVPATAVLSDAGGQRVQVVRDGVVETREVRAGLLWDGKREILSGLRDGEQVIARSGAFFRDGDQVSAVPVESSDAQAAPANESASLADPAAEGGRQP
ncbi:efflux RND transporter periplasmic adaptor subunit [Paracoccus sp. R12_1]|uniref:efflux RND transporter periplasmic adaptor subunit n=1 Tax=unclassified Paracoccus (in: a-proteobacteria) TaxID=2688777 RepID=UPI001ADD2CDB|nr:MULTISPECIES: efflux RND transporter periplasmic adaptor subunit [unclassified Paracoccus (in: a-proteobacteria)]MBO9455642.1 efflux RND transporter periplasmic adaptor subunit [Paracoccus sp. R12_2]MBO9486312.1 efflux RND transporter periplasmic adaptor subunit [Paracoccus sp. R12_1]